MRTEIFCRTPYNYDMNIAGDESGLKCEDPTLTQQHFKEECDINTIVARFNITGEVPMVQNWPTHGDFTGVFDYQTAMNAIVAAREAFQALPAKTRARFHNDPHEFVEFCDDPANLPEALKLGMIDKLPEEKPESPPVTPPAKVDTKPGDKAPETPRT